MLRVADDPILSKMLQVLQLMLLSLQKPMGRDTANRIGSILSDVGEELDRRDKLQQGKPK